MPKYILKQLQRVHNALTGFVLQRNITNSDALLLFTLPVTERTKSDLVKMVNQSVSE